MADISSFRRSGTGVRSLLEKNPLKKILPVGAIMLLVVFLLVWQIGKAIGGNSRDARVPVRMAKAVAQVNKEFQYPVKNEKGVEVTKMKYSVESAELRDEIIVKGQRATAIQGRLFLILTIKIINDYAKSLEINARDYVRLSMNGKDTELLAADIHNDPVLVQPVSTKYTRVGFPINDNDKDFVMHIGELSGKKEQVPLKF